MVKRGDILNALCRDLRSIKPTLGLLRTIGLNRPALQLAGFLKPLNPLKESPLKRLFSKLGKKSEATPPASTPRASNHETTTFLTGDDLIDARNVRSLLDTMAELISDQEQDALIRKIVDRAIKAVAAERGILFLTGPKPDQLQVAVARDDKSNDLDEPRFSTTVVKQVHETGNPLSLKIGDSDQANDLSASVVDLKLRAVMCVRLRFQEKVLGVIYVDSRVTSREFTPKDLRFFDALGVALSISLENARLVNEALERQRLKQSLEIAAEILGELLPEDPAGLGDYDIAGRSEPADAAAGDYYDFIPVSNGLSVVVGDVTGHGIGPAMIMTGARSALRTMFGQDLSGSEALGRLNQRLSEDLADDMFMSMLIAHFENDRRQLHFANAGQSAPLLLRASGELVTLPASGLALGIEPEFEYENQAPIALQSGDVLALFTDGFLEARNTTGEMFGAEGLARVMRDNAEKSAKDILHQVFQETKVFAGSEAIDDDLTLVIVKVR